ELHSLGYDGDGVRIAIIDNGFHYVHDSFAQLEVVAERDFVNGDDVVLDEPDQPVTGDETRSVQNIHGAQVLSLLAGYEPGRFIGVAPRAEYILAKTEDNRIELPIEEDRWIAGLEWADSLGADVVNSSLGYNLWDDGSGYTYEDLDGATALTSIAAELAVRRGIVVVVAAGNEGDNSWRYVTAPADAPGVISVGSVDVPTPGVREPLLAASSSRGPTADGRIKPDVVAPGQWVVAADIRGGDYVRVNGTSFASPMVGGVCALLLQAHPTWSPAEVREALQQSATDLGEAGPDTAYGWGMVDALGASGLQLQRPESLLAGNPFPNPASGEAIHFPLVLNDREDVELRIFDLAGGLVAAVERSLVAGDYTAPGRALRWEIPRELADGLYFYLMQTSSLSRSGKFALVRQRSQVDRQP
ncbi:MAG: S8 family serine peptidase, partial [Gemmatimonadetes bacterium]|nr:S8 family serine peptidase [Gemmatimonadota bacterium]